MKVYNFQNHRAKINLFFNPDTQRVGSDGEARRGGIPPGPLLLVVGGGEGRWADAGDSGHVLLRADQGGGGGEHGGAEGAGLHQAGADTRHHEEPGILPVRTRGLVWIFKQNNVKVTLNLLLFAQWLSLDFFYLVVLSYLLSYTSKIKNKSYNRSYLHKSIAF